jgi:hypothetical protein
MNKLLFKTFSSFASISIIIFSGSTVLAAKNAAPVTALGNDISWPQCNKTLPKGQAFGIVGVNNGLANNTNPCLATQLSWSLTSAGSTGQPKTALDANIRGISNPSTYLWWLDVETINSWESNKSANTADLEGMNAYFQSIGASVGLYSTSNQWNQIAGTTIASSSLYGLNSWIPGAINQTVAKSNCTLRPLTAGGEVTLTQFVSKNLDYDYSCI